MSDGDMPTPLEDWAFNVHLECSREDESLEVAIGGAILNLRDLDAILSAAVDESRVRAEERERAARIAEGSWVPAYVQIDGDEWKPGSPYDRGCVEQAAKIAAAIRSGSEG